MGVVGIVLRRFVRQTIMEMQRMVPFGLNREFAKNEAVPATVDKDDGKTPLRDAREGSLRMICQPVDLPSYASLLSSGNKIKRPRVFFHTSQLKMCVFL